MKLSRIYYMPTIVDSQAAIHGRFFDFPVTLTSCGKVSYGIYQGFLSKRKPERINNAFHTANRVLYQ